MKVKLLKPYGLLAAGAEMDAKAPIAALLIQRRIAEEAVAAPSGFVAALAQQIRPQKVKSRR